jgi:hypothetical protein
MRMAKSNRRNNSIEQLVVNGILSIQTSLRLEIALCSSMTACLPYKSWLPKLDGLTFDSIGEEAMCLWRAFEEDEVFGMVKP